MVAHVFDKVWTENVDAARRVWQQLSRREPARHDGGSRHWSTHGRRMHRRVVGAATAAIAVLALTYSAASALVDGAAGSSSVRTDYLTVMQAASAEYKRARAECLALPFERRDACIAEAHSNESKLRNAATTAPRKQLSQLRKKSDQMLLASRGLDSIVIDPACNVVARGSASVCEIQVKGSRIESPDAIAMVRPAPQVTDSKPVSRLSTLLGAPGRDRDHYFGNVAVLVSP